MKKLITLLLILAMLLPAAVLADLPDISGLSFDELVQLKEQINLAMWNSQEWQEVTVPAGTWKVGEDIPVGHWAISIVGHGLTTVWYCEQVDELGEPVCWGAKYTYKRVASEDFKSSETYPTVIDYDAADGWYLYFDKAVIFTPYTGKPDLGFK